MTSPNSNQGMSNSRTNQIYPYQRTESPSPKRNSLIDGRNVSPSPSQMIGPEGSILILKTKEEVDISPHKSISPTVSQGSPGKNNRSELFTHLDPDISRRRATS